MLGKYFSSKITSMFLALCLFVLSGATVLRAGPALVFDANSDLILYSEDVNQLWHPASLTKLLTAYIVFEELEAGRLTLGSQLISTQRARKEPPSKIGLPLNATMPVELGLRALIVKSANDVAVMFAQKISGSVPAFAARMNKTARKLGMTRSHFVNPHGLPDKRQITTARDMGLLARALIKNYKQYDYLFSLSSVKIGKRVLRSHNDLLRTFPGADGMKTGFICASGFNIVVSATQNNRRLVAVVLGAKSTKDRRRIATVLLNRGFDNYWWKALFPKKVASLGRAQSVSSDKVTNMRSIVCRPRKRVVRRVKRRIKVRKDTSVKAKPKLKKTVE